MHKRLAAIAIAVVALLTVQTVPAVAAPVASTATLTVTLSLPQGYSAPAGLAVDFTTARGYVSMVNGDGVGKSGDGGLVETGGERLAEADAAGVLTFSNLTPGDYYLWVDPPQRSDLLGGGWVDGNLSSGQATPIAVTTGATRVGAALQRGGLLRGTVIDPTGAPVENATVWPSGGKTASDGSFAIGFAPGQGYVSVTAPEGSDLVGGVWMANDVPLSSTSLGSPIVTGADLVVTPSNVVARLSAAGAISGTVRDSSGEPVAGADVSTGSSRSVTASDGSYRLGGLPAGEFRVSVTPPHDTLTAGYIQPDGAVGGDWSRAAVVVVTGGATTSGVDARLTPAGGIRGVVSGLPSSESMSAAAFSSTGEFVGGNSAADGTFTIGHLSPGVWTVRFSLYDDQGLSDYIVDDVSVEVAVNEVETVTARAYLGGSVSGLLRTPTGTAATSGTVQAVGSDGRSSWGSVTSSGAFSVSGLKAGTYRLDVMTPEGAISRDGIVVTSGSETSLGTIELSPPTAAVVHVQDAAGQPIAGANVWLSNMTSGWSATTNAEGDARVTVPTGGDYWYQADVAGYSSAWGSVSLETGATSSLTVTLARSTIVNVTVMDAGQPVSFREVSVLIGGEEVWSGTTDAAGSLRVTTSVYGALEVRLPTRSGESWTTWAGSPVSAPVDVDVTTSDVTVELAASLGIDVSLRGYADEILGDHGFTLALASGETFYGRTDADGTADVSGLIAGEYTVSTWTDDGGLLSSTVTLSPQAPYAAVILSPTDAADAVHVTGVLRDDAGVALPGEQLTVMTYSETSSRSRTVTTSTDGAFSAWLRRGEQYAIVGPVGDDSRYAPVVLDGEVPADGRVQRDVTVSWGRSISLTVWGGTPEDPLGVSSRVPVEDTYVSAYVDAGGSAYSVSRSARTGADGTVTLTGLPPSGDLSGWISGLGYHAGRSVDFADGGEYTLELRGEVSGSVALEGGTGRQVHVHLDSGNGFFLSAPASWTFTSVTPGTHTMTVSAPGWVSRSLSVDVRAGQTTTLPEITLERASSVEGTVTVSGVPLAGARVVGTSGDVEVETTTGSDGSFVLADVSPGDVAVQATWDGMDLAAGVVTVASGAVGRLDLAGDPGVVGSLVRVVVSRSGEGAPHQGHVELVDPFSDRVRSYAWLDGGVAQFTGIAPGMYRMRIDGDSSFLSGWLDLQGAVVDAAEAGRVSIASGTAVAFTANAQHPVTLSGTVRGADGAALAGARVRAGDAVTVTDALGGYTLDVRPSAATLTVSDADGLHVPSEVALRGLAEGEQRTIDVALVPRGAIDVTVTDVDGQPVSGVEVRLESDTAGTIAAYTDDAGVSHLTRLEDVDYRIRVSGPGVDDIAAYVLDEAGEPRVVRLGPGQKLSIGQVLQRYASLRVDLSFADEPHPDETVSVDLIDGSGNVVMSSGALPAVPRIVELSQIAPGDYTARVHSDDFVDQYVAPGASSSDPESAPIVTARGDGRPLSATARLARAWATSTATLEVPDDPSYGEPFTVGARVRIDGRISGTDGMVYRFMVDGAEVAQGWVSPLSAEVDVTLDVPALSVGRHSLSLELEDGRAVRGTSAQADVDIAKAVPAVGVQVTPSYGEYGQPRDVTISAHLASGAGLDGRAQLVVAGREFTVDVVGGSGSISLPGDLAVGAHAVRVLWPASGDTEEVTVDGDDLVVSPRTARLQVTAPTGPIAYSGDVEIPFAVTVDGEAATGTVQLLHGDTVLDEQDAAATAALRSAASVLGAGSHDLVVSYSGDESTAGAAVRVTVEVRGQTTQTTLTGPSAATWGESTTFRVAVTGEVETPTGQVTVRVDGQDAGSATLVDGVADVTLPVLPAGAHRVDAVYSGHGESLGSTSPAADIQIAPAAAGVTLGAIPDGVFGTETPIEARVSVASGTAVTGTVRAWVDGTEVSSSQLDDGTATLMLPASARIGIHEVVVTFDGTADVRAGSSLARSWTMRTGPPVVDLSLRAAAEPLTAGVAQATLDVIATGDGTTPLTYRLWWGDGSPVVTGTYTGPLALSHDYVAAGRYFIRVEVESVGETATYVTARNARFTAYPDVALAAAALDAQSAIVGDDVSFDASSSQPAIAIDGVQWDFGDGATGSGWRTSHVYTEPGTYTATLTVGLGEQRATSSATVTVLPVPPVEGVTVTVTSGGNRVNGATVTHIAADGSRVQAVTAGDGTTLLRGVADGLQPVYVTAGGYLPVAGEVTVVNGDGDLSVELAAGEVAASTLEHRTLSYEEIVDRGIDPADPDNQNVFLAEVHLAIVPPDAPSSPSTQTDVELVYNGGGRVISVVYSGDGWISGGGGDGSAVSGGYRYTPTIVDAGGAQAVQWMIIPVKGSWLKEFFEVRMVVQNLAADPFQFTEGEATLNLPEGLSLAPTSRPQSRTVAVPDIAGGGSQTVYWTLRGDTEGEYSLSADYSGLLAPTGDPIAVTATADRPLKVWGGSAVNWSIATDPSTEALDPFRIVLTLANVTPADTGVPVYNPAFQVMQGTGYLLSPHTDYAKSVPVLQPGQSVQMEFVMHSLLTGDVNVNDPRWAQSFITPTGGNVQPEHGPITLLPERTEALDIAAAWVDMPDGDGRGLALGWETVASANAVYELWGRNTLDPAEPWQPVTDGVREGVLNGRVIAEDSDQLFGYYTVITVFGDGTTKPAHRMIAKPSVPPAFDPQPFTSITVGTDPSTALGAACYDVLNVAVAGSDQPGSMGPELTKFARELAGALSADGNADTTNDGYRSFHNVYLSYPAKAVPLFGSLEVSITDYIGSINTGIEMLEDLLAARQECAGKGEKLVLSGYSQGALVISQVLNDALGDPELMARVQFSRLGGVFLLANPANWIGNGGTRLGTGAYSAGSASLSIPFGGVSPMHRIPGELAGLTTSMCNVADLVCATQNLGVPGLGVYELVKGISVHTSYPETDAPVFTRVAREAAERLLRMPVPVLSEIQATALEDEPFTVEPISLKYLHPDASAGWSLSDSCLPVVASPPHTYGPSSDILQNYAARLDAVSPAGYYSCTLTVTNGTPAFDRNVTVHVRSGWAAIAEAATPKQTVGPDYELKPPAVTITSADGTVVPGAQAVFVLTGPATFPDGSRTITVTADAQGVATAPVPVPVAGENGSVHMTAQIPGRDVVDLGSQLVYGGLPEGLSVVSAAAWDAENSTAALDVLLVNDSDVDASFTLTGELIDPAQPIAAEVAAHETKTVRLSAGSPQLTAGAVLVQARTGSGQTAAEGGHWLVYRDWDPTVVTLTLSTDITSAVYGSPVVVSVAANSAVGAPTGTFELLVDDVAGEQAPAAAAASFVTSTLTAGTHTLAVRLLGSDGRELARSAPVTISVTPATPTVTLTTGTEPALLGTLTPLHVSVRGPGVSVGDPVAILSGGSVMAEGVVGGVDAGEGSATINVDTALLGAGAHTLVARYGGNTNAVTQDSTEAVLTVRVATTVGATVEPVPAGATGELRVTVAAEHVIGDEPLSGLVTVSAPGWSEPLQASLVDGAVRFALPARSVGTLPLTVSYGGRGLYAPSMTSVDAVVVAATAQVALSLSTNAATYGDAPSADVAVTLAGGAVAAGVVKIHEADAGGAPIGDEIAASALADGAARVLLPRLGAGEHRLVAVYAPHTSDASAATSVVATLTVTPLAPALSVVLAESTVVSGSEVHAAASLVALGAAVDATITADLDGKPATVTTAGAAWTVTAGTDGLAAGTHTLTVSALPSSKDYRSVTQTATVTVTARAAGLHAQLDRPVVSVDDAPAVVQITSSAPGRSVAVAWPGGERNVTLDGAGAASVNLPTLAVGSHEVVVSFAGDVTIEADAVSLTYVVAEVAGTVSAIGSSTRYAVERPSVVVSFVGTPTGAAMPSGEVVVREGDEVLATAVLDAQGGATIALPQLRVGDHALTVGYAGDARYAASTAAASVSVAKAPSAITVTWPDAVVSFGSAAVVTASVGVIGAVVPGATSPHTDGDLELLVDGTVVDNGPATGTDLLLPPDLPVGTHVLSVRYAGTALLDAAASSGVIEIAPVATSLQVDAPSSVAWGQPLQVTAALSAGEAALDGTVLFAVGGARVEADARGGRASAQIDTHALAAGTYDLTVSYGGTVTTAPSSRAVTVTITALPSSLSVVRGPSSVPTGLIEFAVQVSTVGEQPTGTVTATSDTGPALAGMLSGGRATLVVPDTIADGMHTYAIAYTGSAGISGSRDTVSFTVARQAPSRQVAPAQSETVAGAQQVVVIDGLEPGETVVVFLHSTPVYLGTATADANGVARLSFEIPSEIEPGQHRIEVRRDSGVLSGFITVRSATGGSDGGSPGVPGAVDPTGPTTSTGTSPRSGGQGSAVGGDRLSATGGTARYDLVWAGLLLILLGGIAVGARRRWGAR